MIEVAVSAAVAALLVVLEAVGILVSRWAVARQVADERGYTAAAKKALEFDSAAPEIAADPAAAMASQIQAAISHARSTAFRRVIGSFVPGPELCYMSLTLQTTLFLGFNYASPAVRQAMSPFLATSRSAFPIMFGLFLINAISWIGTTWWREVIVETLQKRFRKLSIAAIVALGGGNLAATVYLVTAGRL